MNEVNEASTSSELLGSLLEEARAAGAEVTDCINYAYAEDVAVFSQEALSVFVTHLLAAERERWNGVEQYLIAAADGSMSRNNSEQLASELLQQISA